MGNENIILICTACGAKNRVPVSRIDDRPVCGKCKTLLPAAALSRPVNVSDATFNQEVFGSNIPVLVDCWAPWCGPCRAFAPVLDQLASTYRGRLKVAKLNLDENPGTGSRYSITSVPTIMLVKNGQIVDRFAGALPKDHLEDRIAKLL